MLGNCSERRQTASAAASGIEKTYQGYHQPRPPDLHCTEGRAENEGQITRSYPGELASEASMQEDPSRSHLASLGAPLLARAGTDKPHHQIQTTTTNNAARLLYPASPAERARRELSEPEEDKEEK